MSTLTLNFEGWFQMRMATDPDPTDEKRGVSGYTFALAGEPDLDAKVHMQPDEPGVWQRKFGPGDDDGPNLPVGAQSKYGPRVGVTVTSASLLSEANLELTRMPLPSMLAQGGMSPPGSIPPGMMPPRVIARIRS